MAQTHLHVSNRSQSRSHLLATRHQPQVTNVAPTVATWRIIGFPEEVIYNWCRPDGIHVSIKKCWGVFITADWPASSQKRAPITKNICVTLHLLSISKTIYYFATSGKRKSVRPTKYVSSGNSPKPPKESMLSVFLLIWARLMSPGFIINRQRRTLQLFWQ